MYISIKWVSGSSWNRSLLGNKNECATVRNKERRKSNTQQYKLDNVTYKSREEQVGHSTLWCWKARLTWLFGVALCQGGGLRNLLECW